MDEDWRKFLYERKEADITAIIEEEKLKTEETRRFIDNAFRDGSLKTKGTAVDKKSLLRNFHRAVATAGCCNCAAQNRFFANNSALLFFIFLL